MTDQLYGHLGITPTGALSVVLASAILFVAVAFVLRWWGQRLAASSSAFSLAFITLIGAVAARSMLGDSPTLLGGLIALTTLLVLERSFGRWSRLVPGVRPERARPAVLLMVGDQLREAELRRYRITPFQLWSQLRQRGIAHRSDIGLVVLEPDGNLSVVRTGRTVDRVLFAGVRGVDEVPEGYFDPES
ncbi:MAG: YetF domain-containing protein [Candidatus Nanopelagicales bacterium]